jgi:proline iminopeptidase
VWESVSQTDLRNELTELCELSIPSLVIHGRHDPIPLETAEQVAGCLGASLEVFEESGHVPYVEDFEEFVQVLDGFLPKQQ